MFSPAVERALRVALAAHDGQMRKGHEPVPYVAHPFHVALILAQLGFDDTVIQAGLLHDVVEDCQGWTLERVEEEFSHDVRAIVEQLTEDKSKSWEDRKRHGVDHVEHMSAPALSVKAADKLHNLSCLIDDLKRAPDPREVWSRFKGGRKRTLEMSSELVGALERRVDPRLARALRVAMRELEGLAGG